MSVNVFFLEASNMKEYEREKYNVIDRVNHLTEANSKLFTDWPFKQYDSRNRDIAKLLSIRKCLLKAKEMNSKWVVICDETVDFPSRFPSNLIISKNRLIKIICLDKKNKVGKGLPVDEMASVMFHHTTFDFLIQELHSETSTKMQDFDCSTNYLNWIIKQLSVPCARYPMISSISTSEQVSKPVVVEPEPEPEPEPMPEPEPEPEPKNEGYVNFLNAFKKND